MGAIKEYAGGSLAVSLMISLKVYWDYVVCLIFPFQPSPRYFFNGVFLKDPQFILALLFFFRDLFLCCQELSFPSLCGFWNRLVCAVADSRFQSEAYSRSAARQVSLSAFH